MMIVAALAAMACVIAPASSGGPSSTTPASATSAQGASAPQTDDWFTLDGLRLDESFTGVRETRGRADEQVPDINASTRHVWHAGGGGWLAVTSEDAPPQVIVGLGAHVPSGSDLEVELAGGIVLGHSTPADVVRAWGEPDVGVAEQAEDAVVTYLRCRGPWPVVVKFDQPGVDRDPDAPVTAVMIAYADAEPGTAGCPAGADAGS